MDRKEEFSTVMEFARQQKILDMQMTLGQLADHIGDGGEVSDNRFAWDRYIYRTPSTERADLSVEAKKRVATVDRRILNLNGSLGDLVRNLKDNNIDQVAGWIWDQDRMTFIVARTGGGDIDPISDPLVGSASKVIPSIKR